MVIHYLNLLFQQLLSACEEIHSACLILLREILITLNPRDLTYMCKKLF